ncbi:uncharacterized protein EV420DRAFT_1696460 [Desarmillaria tabescens]|uniref:Uncharacterized protein n=1 Tax=Armillaria tabescens TaxID=1929756 RepID=A0AA39K3N8_ARMTA|nr:uncharacterized protein EV420DRAFT_1696460 [Desarmillaria tabescens]KAK0453996.1 hypothetical protein EV420DRAFT_1696460 [Desarmillaria tabescens]
MVSSAKGSFSKRKGSKRTPQSRSPNASDHTNHSNATLQASPPSTEFGFQQIPQKLSRSQYPTYFVSPTVYLTGPLELDDADYQVYLNAADRERRASATHYSNPAQRIAFVSDDWIERIIESTSNVLSEAGAPTSGSKSNSSPDLQPVSPRVRSPHTLGLIDELTDTMDVLHLGPATQPSSPSLEQGVTNDVHTSRDSQTLSLSPALSLT